MARRAPDPFVDHAMASRGEMNPPPLHLSPTAEIEPPAGRAGGAARSATLTATAARRPPDDRADSPSPSRTSPPAADPPTPARRVARIARRAKPSATAVLLAPDDRAGQTSPSRTSTPTADTPAPAGLAGTGARSATRTATAGHRAPDDRAELVPPSRAPTTAAETCPPHPAAELAAPRSSPPDVVALVGQVTRRYREYKFAQTVRISVDHKLLSFVRLSVVGWRKRADEDPDGFKRAMKESERVVRALKKGEPLGLDTYGEENEELLREMFAKVSASRKPFEEFEAKLELILTSLVQGLPGADFVRATRGFGLLGFAMLVGEGGDLGAYRSRDAIWKRFGLAVMPDGRQGRRTNPVLAELHGFRPERRAVAWQISEFVLRAQGHETGGPYRDLYERHKAIYLARGEAEIAAGAEKRLWHRLHCHDAARRLVAKRVIRDLYIAWCTEVGLRHGRYRPPRKALALPEHVTLVTDLEPRIAAAPVQPLVGGGVVSGGRSRRPGRHKRPSRKTLAQAAE